MGLVKFASDYEADQAAMQAEADALNDLVNSNSNIDENTAAEWTHFYNQQSIFDATPVYDLWRPWLPDPHFLATSGLSDTFTAQAKELDDWNKRINSFPVPQGQGTPVPGFTDPTGQQGNANTMAGIATVVKWAAIGILAIAGIQVVRSIP